MNRRWAKLGSVAVALALFALTPVPLRGQNEADVFPDDIELPSLEEETGQPELPPPEELPPGPANSTPPLIDSTMSDPLPSPPVPNAKLEPETADPADNLPFATEEDPAAEDAEGIAAGEALVEPDEIIRERYSDGNVRIERGVRQDDLQNYLNHGPWRMWDQQGRLVVEGAYRDGQPEGAWVRWYQVREAELFKTPPFDLFEGGYISRATFRAGKLHGHWIITDQNDRKISDWVFAEGRRDGKSLWWYQNGNKMREINYVEGQVHGELLEWDEGGRLVTRVQYEEGRRLDQTVRNYKSGQKQIEGMVLHARLIMKQPDDWWKTKLATYVQEGKDQKHGAWSAWYEDGKKKFQGNYDYDRPAGEFVWWHPNGQKALVGSYQNGKKNGTWSWWHPNGQKSIEGQYRSDSAIDQWIWWHESGKVAQRVDFSAAGGQVVSLPEGRLDLDAESMGRSIMLNQPRNWGETLGGGE